MALRSPLGVMQENAKPETAFVFDFGEKRVKEEPNSEKTDLQQSFLKFRHRRQQTIKDELALKKQALEERADPKRMWELRMKFLEQCKKYFGVPYAKRYHPAGSQFHDSPLFLDCCGLVRRVLKDLKEDFGFVIGTWNQSYQFDTLPKTLTKEEMKPGDLVFISGIYYNPKSKKQRHNMVHVEVWLGDGVKTIGARWQKGVVQIFDSYQFVSKSYHSMTYHFKSIDTWLMGICKSFCNDHKWKRSKFIPTRRSVFSLEEPEDDEDESAGGEEEQDGFIDGAAHSRTSAECTENTANCQQDEQAMTNCYGSSSSSPHDGDDNSGNSQGQDSSTSDSCTSAGSDSAKSPPTDGEKSSGSSQRKKKSSDKTGGGSTLQTQRIRATRFRETGPGFYIGGGNGVSLVANPLLARGWHRVVDKFSTQWKLRWVELKSRIDYHSFREGEQLVNRIPNSSLLATKTGLLSTLREYERVTERTKTRLPHKLLKMSEFIPQSYILDIPADRDSFFEDFKEGDTWICKPTGMNQGRGIYLVKNLDELKKKYCPQQDDLTSTGQQQKRKMRPPPMQRLIQRYLENPLLLDGKKFDVRAYMLVACTNPFVVFFHQGYCRLSCLTYDHDSQDMTRHLTNQFVQKKDPMYGQLKEETSWSMDKFNDYVNEHFAKEKDLPQDWVFGEFTKRMTQIMQQCFHSVRNKLQCKLGFFDLLGFDFIVDTEMKVWLLEVNVNPALHTHCQALKEVNPGVVKETLDLTLEVFEKSKRNLPLTPFQSLKNFQLLYNGERLKESTSATSLCNNKLGGVKIPKPKISRSRSLSPEKRKGAAPAPKLSIGASMEAASGRIQITPEETEIVTAISDETESPLTS